MAGRQYDLEGRFREVCRRNLWRPLKSGPGSILKPPHPPLRGSFLALFPGALLLEVYLFFHRPPVKAGDAGDGLVGPVLFVKKGAVP